MGGTVWASPLEEAIGLGGLKGDGGHQTRQR